MVLAAASSEHRMRGVGRAHVVDKVPKMEVQSAPFFGEVADPNQ